MKSLLDYKGGERIEIVETNELLEILELYNIDFVDIFIDHNKEYAEKIIGVLGKERGYILKSPRELIRNDPDWNGLVPLLLDCGVTIQLPMVAFIDCEDGDNYLVEYNDDNDNEVITSNSSLASSSKHKKSSRSVDTNIEDLPLTRHAPSEEYMVHLFAAETIQSAYRRYRTCKDDIRKKKALSSQAMVANMAAQTIQEGFRKLLMKPKSKEIISVENNRTDARDYNVMRMISILADNMANVVWNGLNDAYIILKINQYTYRTETLHESGKSAHWKLSDIVLPYSNTYTLRIEIYHENLARDDQLIGETTLSFESLKHTNKEQTLKLSLQNNRNNSNKQCGDVTIVFALDIGVPMGNIHSIYTKPKVQYIYTNPVDSLKNSDTNESPIMSTHNSNSNSKTLPPTPPNRNTVESVPKFGVYSRNNSESRIHSNMSRQSSRHSQNELIPNKHISVADTTPKARNVYTNSYHSEKKRAERLIIDDAYRSCKIKYGSSVKLSYDEVDTILEALGYDCSKNTQQQIQHVSLGSYLDLPLTNSAPLAAILTKYIKSKNSGIGIAQNNSNITVSEANANIAMKQLSDLIEGEWSSIRNLILKYCNPNNGNGKPENWPNEYVVELFECMDISTNMSIYQSCAGNDFLHLDRRSLRHECGIKASILQHRVILYQQVLCLIDQWWDKGIRPNDISRSDDYILESESKNKLIHSKSNLSNISNITSDSATKVKDSMLKKKHSTVVQSEDNHNTNVSSSSSSAITLSHTVVSSQSKSQYSWGVLPNRGKTVEIQTFNALMDAYMPMNRTYAWDISMDILTRLCSKISENIGILIQNNETNIEMEINSLEEIKGCRWVKFLSDSNVSSNDSSLRYELEQLLNDNKCIKCHSIIRKLNSNNSYAILVPLLCMREYTPVSDQSSVIPSDNIHIGMIVRIASEDILKRLFEIYEWWDKPKNEVICILANKKAEIVSISEIYTKNRVGIRVKLKDKSEIFDVVPIKGVMYYEKKHVSKNGNKNTNKKTRNKTTKKVQSSNLMTSIRSSTVGSLSNTISNTNTNTNIAKNNTSVLTKKSNVLPNNMDAVELELSVCSTNSSEESDIDVSIKQYDVKNNEHVPISNDMYTSDETNKNMNADINYSWLKPKNKPIIQLDSNSEYLMREELRNNMHIHNTTTNNVKSITIVPEKNISKTDVFHRNVYKSKSSNQLSHISPELDTSNAEYYMGSNIGDVDTIEKHKYIHNDKIYRKNLKKPMHISSNIYNSNGLKLDINSSDRKYIDIYNAKSQPNSPKNLMHEKSHNPNTANIHKSNDIYNDLSIDKRTIEIQNGLGILGSNANNIIFTNTGIHTSDKSNGTSGNKSKSVHMSRPNSTKSSASRSSNTVHPTHGLKKTPTTVEFSFDTLNISDKTNTHTNTKRPKSANNVYSNRQSHTNIHTETRTDVLNNNWTEKEKNIYRREMQRSEKEYITKEKILEKELKRMK